MPTQLKKTVAMGLTGARRTQWEATKVALQTKAIDVATYNKLVADLNRQQRKADKRAKEADAIRIAKELEAERQARIAEAKKDAEREERRKAKQQQRNEKRKAERALQRLPTKAIATFSFTYQFNYKSDQKKRIYDKEKTVSINYNPSVENLEKVITDYINSWVEQEEAESPVENVEATGDFKVSSNITPTPTATNTASIRMRDATALDLDGGELQTWDTKNNTCVYDFIIWRYKDRKGCKKICNYETLDRIFKERDDEINRSHHTEEYIESQKRIKNHFIAQRDYLVSQGDTGIDATIANFVIPEYKPRTDGVSALHLVGVADRLKVRMYALDEKDKIILTHTPTVINKDAPPLVFKIKDKHFYALCDRAMEISRIGKRKTELEEVYKKKCDTCGQDDKPTDDELPVVVVEQGGFPFMVEQMRKVGKQAYPFKNIRVGTGGLQSFILDGKRFMFDEDDSVKNAIEIMKLNEQPYTGQTTYSILIDMLNELNYTKKSVYNPNAFRVITESGVKWRTHYGATTDLKAEQIKQMCESNEAICADITKCYTSCLMKPMSEWLIYNFNDDWEPYQGVLMPGLYFVETDDNTLFHYSNIYSHTMIEKAIGENIPHTIKTQYIPSNKPYPKSYFLPLLDRIDEVCKGDPALKKSLTNIITGFLGKHKTDKYVVRMNTDTDVIWNDFTDENFHQNKTFMYQCEEFYLYGFVNQAINAENNIPIYIQILDASNIRLYDMIKQSGGKCVFRKTDCAVIVGGSLDFVADDVAQPGDYRSCSPPSKVSPYPDEVDRECLVQTLPDEFITYPEIYTSSQTQEVYDLLMSEGGIVNVSRAGTGKSYNVLEIEKKFMVDNTEGKVIKLAFTNKACLNIRGTTIHRFLKLNRDNKFNLEWLRSFADKKVLIIVDEISMLSSFLWRCLVELKKVLPNAFFILCGDYRQIPPVEEGNDNYDYFKCSALRFLSCGNKIEFSQRQRYDERLWDFAEEVWEDPADKRHHYEAKTPTLDEMVGSSNICYFNRTRKQINARLNKYVAEVIDRKIELPFVQEEFDPKALQQDAIIYPGLPIISIKNCFYKQDGKTTDEMETANNEMFEIIDFDSDFFVCETQRLTEEGDLATHTITIPLDEFHNRFVLNYATTTHKSQGATIDNNIIVWDYEQMTKNLKYTAITRAKKLSQISIANNNAL